MSEKLVPAAWTPDLVAQDWGRRGYEDHQKGFKEKDPDPNIWALWLVARLSEHAVEFSKMSSEAQLREDMRMYGEEAQSIVELACKNRNQSGLPKLYWREK